MTTPLITNPDGSKMGKTAQGAVWLNEEQLSPYDYWQFWRNTDDANVGKFLRLFTDLPLEEVARLEGLPGAQINEAKIVLATEATALLHGRDAAQTAARTARDTFEAGGAGGDFADLVRRRRREHRSRTHPAGFHAVQQGSQAQDRRGRGLSLIHI